MDNHASLPLLSLGVGMNSWCSVIVSFKVPLLAAFPVYSFVVPAEVAEDDVLSP